MQVANPQLYSQSPRVELERTDQWGEIALACWKEYYGHIQNILSAVTSGGS